MKQDDLAMAKHADLRGSLAAMRRAAAAARKTAIQTETGIVLVHEGRPVKISAAELRKAKA